MGKLTQLSIILMIALLPNIHGWWLGRPRTSASVNVHRDPYTGRVGYGGSVSVTWGGRKKRSVSSGEQPMPLCTRACDSSSADNEVCTFVCERICISSQIQEATMVPKMIPKIFKMFDQDGNDEISVEETSATTHVPLECVLDAFQIADKDDNNVLSVLEFKTASWNFIEIDEAEARALMADPEKYRRLLEDISDETEVDLDGEK